MAMEWFNMRDEEEYGNLLCAFCECLHHKIKFNATTRWRKRKKIRKKAHTQDGATGSSTV